MKKPSQRPAILYSNRLCLRPFEMRDAERLARITNDPLVTRNLLKTTTPFTIDDARQRILRLRQRNSLVWAIDNGQLIGLIGIAGEFGYWLARSAWGKGYATEAARLVIDHAFEGLAYETLHANPIADNKPSRRLLEKLGFKQYGRAIAFCRERGKIVTLVKYRCEGNQHSDDEH
ncbi:GNAT family N-acetyltransferase [Agrobacterium larrymoorei]|uniref:GNAT family N-acetyltransferase n=1 Tax=Agrobacterium larrymoorei TaxID=160699 RepID=A0AAF0HAY3_9HYPH|nr:GNAT family N-acetyltransferase [Agrobacterium larrymoorei]WHA42307.1 GNAT family N-acetyltransferase [Agrobacterium larrymoorei]